MSLFVSFEGGEGSGKSTQARLLAERLQKAGVSLLSVREPGTTSLGLYLREWLKRKRPKEDALSRTAELFLFAAARAELVSKVIRPSLMRRDTVVVADRYADSTLAYQAYGRRLSVSDVDWVNTLATGGTMPDLTFLLDCPPEDGLSRVGSRQIGLPMEGSLAMELGRADEEEARRFEDESLDFHARVRSGYLEVVEKEPDRWCVIDATRPIGEIGDLVWKRVQERLSRHAKFGSARSASPELPLWADQHDSAAKEEGS